YLQYLGSQVDPELLKRMTALANQVEKDFNAFRARVDGQELTENQIREVLRQSTDSDRRKAVWTASKKVGEILSPNLKELVRLRNQAAKSLGFDSFHALQLHLNEQNGEDLLKLFDELDNLTREPFQTLKREIDAELAKRCGISTPELRPWHYHDPFFQESPAVFSSDLDAPYRNADILKLCRDFYQGIGLPIDRVLGRSDLYEKSGKSPHAFCTDIDRQGDVRVLANIVPNEYWASTMLHELGHAVYSSLNIPETMPYILRSEAHILATEGIAMQFERFSKKTKFLAAMGIPVTNPLQFEAGASKALRARLLIFSRWCQVMLRFEKSMYEKPDQDLNKLWWDLVEKYQGLKRPEERNQPDYASKIHIVSAPVYYHNYMMGELFASQVHDALCRKLYPGESPRDVIYINNKEVGTFLKEKVFSKGRLLPWNDLVRTATGENLNAKAFARDFQP
ncbi:MAG: M2 family metallopeptidase, partial [Gemmataceae bacterium]